MDPGDDAYGAAIRDYHEGESAFEAIERDDGLLDLTAGPAAYFAGYEDWPERVRQGIDRSHGRVLDVGCGAGRHALYLQGEGHDVVGIDVSPGAVAVCRDRGLDAVRECGIEDVRDLDGTFDTVLLLGNNFGLVGNRATAPDRLEKLADVTVDDATLIAESRDPYGTDDPVHLAYHERNLRRGCLPGLARIRTRYRQYATDWFDYLMVAPDEMRYLLADTPWRVEEVIGGDGGMYVAVLGKG